ncbi:MAG: helix-turn-helix domain-containing protein [Clostridia bacterium]|nr:helix-turn-helix domain-containing protein [Clostridia bacterium]
MKDIGSNIKRLRLSKTMTQEQLAEKLNISAQAVSKWENGTTTPDIMMLPELSVIFGVTIDELFTMTDEARFERIDNMLWDVRFIPESTFRDTERFLKEKTGDPAVEGTATLLLAQLYNKRADEYHDMASPLARRALELLPDRKDAHSAIFDAEKGPCDDWNCSNHHELIEFYKDFVGRHPDDRRCYYWLLDLLIADGRTVEAREYLEKLKTVAYTFHYELYLYAIQKKEGDMPTAEETLNAMLKNHPDEWMTNFSYANEMAKLCRYDEAVEYFKKDIEAAPKPRFVDPFEAIAHICEIRGDLAGAIEMYREAMEVMKTEWNETEGEGIDRYLREIDRLEKKM